MEAALDFCACGQNIAGSYAMFQCVLHRLPGKSGYGSVELAVRLVEFPEITGMRYFSIIFRGGRPTQADCRQS